MPSNNPDTEFIAIGRILSPWGADGWVRVEVVTDFPERFTPGAEVFLDGVSVTIREVEWQRSRAFVKLETVNGIEAAAALKGRLIEIPSDRLKPLDEGSYYQFQIIGLEVRTVQGDILGKIREILSTSGNDTYVVQGDSGDILIPAAEEIIRSVDIENGFLVIEPIRGLLELNKKAA